MRCLTLLAAAIMAAASALAQSSGGGGTIQGVVKDPSGAVVPNAKVAITHVETGVSTGTVTNTDGFFTTPTLVIGNYKVRIASPGMKSWEGDLLLETGKTTEVSPVLSVGTLNESVVVMAAAPLITTTDPTQGSTVDHLRIEELPINGRDLQTLIEAVTPGIDGGRVNGMFTYSSNYMQDGAGANQPEDGGPTVLQGLDSIGEVRVETSTSSARYDAPASIMMTTRSGTNLYHGSLFETMRNNSLGIARARQDYNPSGAPYQAPRQIRNEFGGSIGGPVTLPSFGLNGRKTYDGKNRTFFFYSQEGRELRQYTTGIYAVPTVAWRNGDFSGLVDSQGRAVTLYNPWTTAVSGSGTRQVATRTPFPNNIIPITMESPLAKYIYSITPLPNDITNPYVTSNLTEAVPNPNETRDASTIRLDHRISNNDNFFIKVNWSSDTQNSQAPSSRWGPPTTNNAANIQYQYQSPVIGSLNWTHIFTPALFVETMLNRSWTNIKLQNGPTLSNFATQLGLPNPFNQLGWPELESTGISQNGTYYEDYENYTEQRKVQDIQTVGEQNYSWVHGTHNLSFGWRFRIDRQPFQPDQNAVNGDRNVAGTAYFNSDATSTMDPTSLWTNAQPLANTGANQANLFLGVAASYTVSRDRATMHLTEKQYAFYVQDNYKVTDRLTVTPGIRWDLDPAFTEDQYLVNGFDVASHSIMLPQPLSYYYSQGVITPGVVAAYQAVGVKFASAQQLGVSPNVFSNNWFDVGPRAGFAYRVTSGNRPIVLRGGYGLYFSPEPARQMLGTLNSNPPFIAIYEYQPNVASYSPDGYTNYLLRTVPTIVAGANSSNAVDVNNPVSVGIGQPVYAVASTPTTRIHEWNIALEKQLSSTTVLRLTYAGKHGLHLDQDFDINPAPQSYVWYKTTGLPLPTGTYSSVATRPYDQTAYTDVYILQRTGVLNSTTLSAEIQRRFARGLGFQAFYALTNAFRMGGNGNRDDVGSMPQAFLPGAVPADPNQLNRFLNYQRDTGIPQHRFRWNWVYELPVGHGRQFLNHTPKLVDAAIGGWRLSGIGTILSTWFTLPVNNWGALGPIHVYGRKYKIEDCRSTPATATTMSQARCTPGYLWYNAYISQRYINAVNAYGVPDGIEGVPANYQSADLPTIPWPAGGQPGAAGSTYWDTNDVYVKLNNGTQVLVALNTNLHPWRNQYMLGPFNFNQDASLMKYFAVSERFKVRASLDLFNLFNTQGINAPSNTASEEGIVSLATSYSGFLPRQLQVGLRIEW